MFPPLIHLSHLFYKTFARRLLFRQDAEKVHIRATALGERFGHSRIAESFIGASLRAENASLAQVIGEMTFLNPVGLAAGFDHEARLTQILPTLGFGFGTVGTITNSPCEGNPSPQLGRLLKSKSLVVNKGFKNPGMDAVLEKLRNYTFEIPAGISIGRTNTKEPMSQKEAVRDIVSAFEKVGRTKVPFAYYELNISCPNLSGSVEFYSSQHLKNLLDGVFETNPAKPIFVKMPITRGNKETLEMLEVISSFSIQGVILSNLHRDRSNPSLVPEEITKCAMEGAFSGKPTWERSNELIQLAYEEFGEKLTIIGCGGVFNAKDAYTKIRLGASLVQFITGMIFEGPQLAAQINLGLIKLLKRDGFANISEAIGIDTQRKTT